MKIIKSLFLLLGFAVFIPITGCSQFAGVSKNCDELASKYLKIRFENAAANNEGPPTQIAVIESSQNVNVRTNGIAAYDYKGSLISLKVHTINQSGTISVFPEFTVLAKGSNSPSPTTPEVATSSQIVCRYTSIGGLRNYTYNSQTNTYIEPLYDHIKGEYVNNAGAIYGYNIQVSEDKDNLYWK